MHDLIRSFALWFEHNKGRSGETVDNYCRHLTRLDIFLFNRETELLKATRGDLEAFAGQEAHKQGLLPQTRKPLVAAMRAFYKWLVDENKLEASPAAEISYPKAGKPLPTYIRRDHVEKLLVSIRDLNDFINARDVAILALLADCGLRASGLSGLNHESLYQDKDEEGFARHHLRVTEKGKKERIVPVSQAAHLWLMSYMHHPEYESCKPHRLLETGEHVLFVQTNRGNCAEHLWHGEKRRLSRRGLNRMIIRRGTKLGIPREELKPHAFRHLYGTELLENGAAFPEIQVLMGHSSLTSTKIYTHLTRRRLADLVERASPLSNMNTPVNQIINEMKNRGNRAKA